MHKNITRSQQKKGSTRLHSRHSQHTASVNSWPHDEVVTPVSTSPWHFTDKLRLQVMPHHHIACISFIITATRRLALLLALPPHRARKRALSVFALMKRSGKGDSRACMSVRSRWWQVAHGHCSNIQRQFLECKQSFFSEYKGFVILGGDLSPCW